MSDGIPEAYELVDDKGNEHQLIGTWPARWVPGRALSTALAAEVPRAYAYLSDRIRVAGGRHADVCASVRRAFYSLGREAPEDRWVNARLREADDWEAASP